MILSLLLDELHHLKKTNTKSASELFVWCEHSYRGMLRFVSHLIKTGGEQVEWRHDAAVGSEAVLLHHLLVVHRVPDVWKQEDRQRKLTDAEDDVELKVFPAPFESQKHVKVYLLSLWCVMQILNALLEIQHRTSSFKFSLVWMSRVQQTHGSLPMFAGKGTSWTAGSRLMTYGGALRECRWAVSLCRKQKYSDYSRLRLTSQQADKQETLFIWRKCSEEEGGSWRC